MMFSASRIARCSAQTLVFVNIMIKIDLLSLTQPALIVPYKTGIIYSNQAEGTGCAHPELEGYLVPIEYNYEHPNESLSYALSKIFPESNPGCIDLKEANQIQELLAASPFTSDIKIDWKKLNESFESWLHVVINGSLDDTININTPVSAVLTWPNSD